MTPPEDTQAGYTMDCADDLLARVEAAVAALRSAAAQPPILSRSGVTARPASAVLHAGMQEVQELLGRLLAYRLAAIDETQRLDRACQKLARQEERLHGTGARRSFVAAHEQLEQTRNEHIATRAQLERAIKAARDALAEAASTGLPGEFEPRSIGPMPAPRTRAEAVNGEGRARQELRGLFELDRARMAGNRDPALR